MEKIISEIIADVRMVIDENEDNSALITEVDEVANDTDKIIRSILTQSIDEVHQMAPLWRTSDIIASIDIALENNTYGEMPADFLRFVYADAKDWALPVYNPIDQDSDEYKMQRSEFAGIRGSAEKPVVAIVPYKMVASGLRVEVYSTESDKLNLVYLKKAKEEEGKLEVAELSYPAILRMIAKHYMINIGEQERAKYYDAMAMELLDISANSE